MTGDSGCRRLELAHLLLQARSEGGADTSAVLSGQGAKHMPNSSCSSGCMRAQGVLGCALGEGSFGAMYRNNLNQAVVGCLS